VGGYPALFTIDSVNSWVGALALDLGADGNDQDTALTVNNKNLIILNDGSTSETSIGQYDSQTFGIARNLTFDGSGLTTTQIDTSQGHAFINLETTSASGIIHFGVGAPNTLVTDQDYVMSVVQNASYSQVVIEPSATIALGSNSITSDLTASSIKTLNGNHLTYKTGTFDIATADELTVNTDTFTASSEGTYMKGYISVEGPSTLSYIDLTKSGNGAALIYDSGNSSIQLAQTTYTQVSGIGTSNIETAFLTAHMNSGYPQVDFEAFTAVSGTIDHLVLSSGIDVPYAVIGDLFVNTTDITAAHIEHLTSTDSCTLENDVMFAAANIIYSSGTIFSQEVNTATGYVTRDAYAVTVSGSDQYFIGAGQIGEASQGYPGVEIQQARPEPTTPTNFRI